MDTYSPYEIMTKGGIIMWPILVTSIVAVAVIIERFISLRRASIDTQEFMETMRQVLRRNRIQEALEICDETDAPVARIMKAGILHHNRSVAEIRQAVEDAGRMEIPRLERYLAALATCSSIAPLLGLLGTIEGMIKAFSEITEKGANVAPTDLAEGIGNALIATGAGLTIAIPCLIFYNYFTARVDNMIIEMEIMSSELVNLLTKHHGEREI